MISPAIVGRISLNRFMTYDPIFFNFIFMIILPAGSVASGLFCSSAYRFESSRNSAASYGTSFFTHLSYLPGSDHLQAGTNITYRTNIRYITSDRQNILHEKIRILNIAFLRMRQQIKYVPKNGRHNVTVGKL